MCFCKIRNVLRTANTLQFIKCKGVQSKQVFRAVFLAGVLQVCGTMPHSMQNAHACPETRSLWSAQYSAGDHLKHLPFPMNLNLINFGCCEFKNHLLMLVFICNHQNSVTRPNMWWKHAFNMRNKWHLRIKKKLLEFGSRG